MKVRHYPRELLERIDELAELEPHREICGFVMTRADGKYELAPVPNVIDQYHRQDPLSYPLTSRDGYLMDPLGQLKVLQEVERGEGELIAVYHSHVGVSSEFSKQDQVYAVVNGRPMVPGAEYLIVSVREGVVDGRSRYVWNGSEYTAVPL